LLVVAVDMQAHHPYKLQVGWVVAEHHQQVQSILGVAGLPIMAQVDQA
jgi:hypothetical protein